MNKLFEETSPYLLQHADNPVDWLPWSAESLELAREKDKPILLSIGYSACHWCHVMAHESFEDPATAELMNRLYINIKVDREERPDLDKIYQGAHSLLTQRPGGWPLTVFLDPRDQMPIFAGTYFPREPRQGMPSFMQMLVHIHDIYQERKDDIAQQTDTIRNVFEQLANQGPDKGLSLSAMPLDIARNQIEQQFDSRYGGYSPAPKFPHVAILEQAMRHWYRSGGHKDLDQRILHTALFSATRMCEGGLFDHLGGGFFRYSTDEKWMIPHFEKMLYDNGPLLSIMTTAWNISHEYCFKHAARETAQWVMREMQSDEGGYYSAIDADSEGEEGLFYTWQNEEIEELCDGTGLEMLTMRFGLDRPANFEGKWHLHGFETEDTIADEFDLDPAACHRALFRLRDTLLTRRQTRIRPGLDDKIITSWNALMITGMAQAGRHLQQPRYIESATRAVEFVYQQHWKDGRLLATSRHGKAKHSAYLDDYAFLLQALMELLQSRWERRWMDWILEIADILIQQFEDDHHGGFFFTSHDHESLIQRSKSNADEAIPSGSGIACLYLQRLGFLTGVTDYLDAAEAGLLSAWKQMNENAIAHCTMLQALDEYLSPPTTIILRGNQQQLDAWLEVTCGLYLPDVMILPVPAEAELEGLEFIDNKHALEGACAWFCEGTHCQPAITELDEFRENLVTRAEKTSPAVS